MKRQTALVLGGVLVLAVGTSGAAAGTLTLDATLTISYPPTAGPTGTA